MDRASEKTLEHAYHRQQAHFSSPIVRERLDHPVIDTDIHTNDYAPALEDYIASYDGVQLVDELRKASQDRIERGGVNSGKTWYEQTPEERQYHRTSRAPWWARVTKNTLDAATYHIPELLYQRQAEQSLELVRQSLVRADGRRKVQNAFDTELEQLRDCKACDWSDT